MSDDPFDDIDADPDEEDDPFSDLVAEESVEEESLFDPPEDDDAPPDGPRLDDNPFTEMETGPPEQGSTDAGTPMPEQGSGDADASGAPTPDQPDLGPSEGDDPFADLSRGADTPVDDDLWEDLSKVPDEVPLSEQQGPRRFSEVSKHRFCEQCPHFTGPPEIACTHARTDIIEFVDMETVRVADCPIVKEREALQDQ